MGHEIQDAASLEMARRVAADLPSHPEWVALAQDNLRRWRDRNADSPPLLRCYDEWSRLLTLPIEQLCALMTHRTDEGQRLRQNSPFTGVLSPQTVRDIKQRARNDKKTA